MTMVYRKPAPLVRVKEISRSGESVLIEWHDGQATQRAYLPAGELQRPAGRHRSNEWDARAPEQGAPHGLPWAELIRLTVTAAEAETALHQFGIWTAADIERHHAQALAALQSLYARDLSALIRAARSFDPSTYSAEEESTNA